MRDQTKPIDTDAARRAVRDLTVRAFDEVATDKDRSEIDELTFDLRKGWLLGVYADLRLSRGWTWERMSEATGYTAQTWRNLLSAKVDTPDAQGRRHHVSPPFIRRVTHSLGLMDYELDSETWRQLFNEGFRVSPVVANDKSRVIGVVCHRPDDSDETGVEEYPQFHIVEDLFRADPLPEPLTSKVQSDFGGSIDVTIEGNEPNRPDTIELSFNLSLVVDSSTGQIRSAVIRPNRVPSL